MVPYMVIELTYSYIFNNVIKNIIITNEGRKEKWVIIHCARRSIYIKFNSPRAPREPAVAACTLNNYISFLLAFGIDQRVGP